MSIKENKSFGDAHIDIEAKEAFDRKLCIGKTLTLFADTFEPTSTFGNTRDRFFERVYTKMDRNNSRDPFIIPGITEEVQSYARFLQQMQEANPFTDEKRSSIRDEAQQALQDIGPTIINKAKSLGLRTEKIENPEETELGWGTRIERDGNETYFFGQNEKTGETVEIRLDVLGEIEYGFVQEQIETYHLASGIKRMIDEVENNLAFHSAISFQTELEPIISTSEPQKERELTDMVTFIGYIQNIDTRYDDRIRNVLGGRIQGGGDIAEAYDHLRDCPASSKDSRVPSMSLWRSADGRRLSKVLVDPATHIDAIDEQSGANLVIEEGYIDPTSFLAVKQEEAEGETAEALGRLQTKIETTSDEIDQLVNKILDQLENDPLGGPDRVKPTIKRHFVEPVKSLIAATDEAIDPVLVDYAVHRLRERVKTQRVLPSVGDKKLSEDKIAPAMVEEYYRTFMRAQTLPDIQAEDSPKKTITDFLQQNGMEHHRELLKQLREVEISDKTKPTETNQDGLTVAVLLLSLYDTDKIKGMSKPLEFVITKLAPDITSQTLELLRSNLVLKEGDTT